MDSAPSFDIAKLRVHAERRTQEKLKLYNRILARAHRRIEVAAKHASRCIFQVPEFELGMPLYDAYQCSGYIIAKLRKDGFHVTYYNPHLLHIDWAPTASSAAAVAMPQPPQLQPPLQPPTQQPPTQPPLPLPQSQYRTRSQTAQLEPTPCQNYVPTGKLFM